MSNISRRRFLESTAGVAAALSVPPRSVAQSRPSAITPPLSQVEYSEVQLLDGPLKQQFDQNHEFFLNLSEDRVLKIFRQRAGLPAPGEWIAADESSHFGSGFQRSGSRIEARERGDVLSSRLLG